MGVTILSGTVPAIFFVGYLLTGFLSLLLFFYTLRYHRTRPVGRAFAVLAVAVSIWGFGYVARMSSSVLETKLFWHAVAFIGVLTTPPALLVFTLVYTRDPTLVTSKHIAGLALIPVGGWIVLVTNDTHHLFYTSTKLYLANTVPILTTAVGPLFWVLTTINWGLMLVAVGLLTRYALTNNTLYRVQSGALLVGAGVPWLVNILFLFGVRLHPVLDPTPVAIAGALLAFWVAIFRVDALSMTPMARDTVFDTIHEPVFVIDRQGRLIDVNRSARQQFDLPAECVGTAAPTVLPTELWTTIETHTDDDWEYHHTSGTADRVYLVRRRPLNNSRGRRWGTVLTLADITKQRRQQEQLEDFAQIVSHDLRNPLNVAQGRVRLLQTEGEEESQEHLVPLANALERMETIIEETLTLVRQGDTIDELQAIPVSDLVNECWMGVETDEATLKIEDSFTIRGDRNRLRHVFENLFRNAIEHGGDDVTVRVGRAGDSSFYVEDDGPGISVSDRTTVFEAGHTSATGGTGFGLTIVKRISEAHDWKVTVTEGHDGGARFEFDSVKLINN